MGSQRCWQLLLPRCITALQYQQPIMGYRGQLQQQEQLTGTGSSHKQQQSSRKAVLPLPLQVSVHSDCFSRCVGVFVKTLL